METAAKPRLTIPNAPVKRGRSGDPESFFARSGEKQLPGTQNTARTVTQSTTQFIIGIEQRIRSLRANRNPNKRDCAEEILAILRELIRFQEECPSIDAALPHFYSELWMERPVRRLLEGLLRTARGALHTAPGSAGDLQYDCAEQILLLDYFVSWYGRRKAALLTYTDYPLCQSADALILGVIHDQIYLGARGFEVHASVRVDGLEFQTLWLKLGLYCDSKPVNVRSAWHYWREDTELFNHIRAISDSTEGERFASVVPVTPHDQRAIFDGIKLFVPYAALDLPQPSRQQLDCEISLHAANGMTLSSDACSETIALPESSPERAVPSPSALGFWPEFIGQGDSIEIVLLAQQCELAARREIHSLKVRCDITCVDRIDEELAIEIRLMTGEGNLIESEIPSCMSRDGSFLLTRTLNPKQVISRYTGSDFTIPLVALELDPGRHDLLLEITILSRDRKVICGTLEPLILKIPDSMVDGTERSDPLIESGAELTAGILLTAFSVNTDATFNLGDAIRLDVSLFDQSARPGELQVRAKLETRLSTDSRPILRGLSLPATKAALEQELVFVFSGEEVLEKVSAGSGPDLLATVEVLDPRGKLLLSACRELSVDTSFGRQRLANSLARYAADEVEIVSSTVRETPQRGGEYLLDLILNFSHGPERPRSYSLHIEPVNPGRNLMIAGSLNPDGYTTEIEMPATVATMRSMVAVVQHRFAIRLPHSLKNSSPGGLKLMLFSPSGRLLQVVYEKLRVTDRPPSREPLLPMH